MSRSREPGRAYLADVDDFDGQVVRRRRITVSRVLLNLAILAAFAIAVYTMYTLIQNSGILGESEDGAVSESMFIDVPDTDPHAADLQDAAILGLVETSSPTRFGVREPVTRGDLSFTVVKTLGLEVPVDGVHAFADVEGDPEVLDQSDYIAVAVDRGFMTGMGGDPPLFEPDTTTSVGEVLVVFATAGGEALPEASPEETSTTDTTAADTSTTEPTTDTTAAAGTEGESQPSPEVLDAHARLTAAGILDDLDVETTDEALSAGARKELVALIAVNMRRYLDSL